MTKLLLRTVLASVLLVGGWAAVSGVVPAGGELRLVPAALADDDGDDGDDDGGDDDGDDGGGGWGGRSSRGDSVRGSRGDIPLFRNFFDRAVPRAPRRQARRAAPPSPAHAPDELVAVLAADDLTAAEELGFEVIADEEVELTGERLARLRVPEGLALAEARRRLTEARPAVATDLNHYYRPENEPACPGGQCLARSLIEWPAAQELAAVAPRIGLVDTGINLEHEALKGQKIDLTVLSGEARDPSSKIHGTAIAALLVGARDSRAPGLLPDAELVAVDAFHSQGKDDRTDVYDLVRAMNIVVGKDVDVLNLSLTGPDNAVLKRAVAAIAARDIMMVAAAGNKGPNADPLYPAAYPNVTVATAVDRRLRPYRRAGRGEHIDFAAPGVGVWTAASISGARTKTGTSFAAPFITAAIAYIRAQSPQMTREEVKQALAATVDDLGDPGRDPVFGWGLLRMNRLELAENAGLPPQNAVAPETPRDATGTPAEPIPD
jgi:subtilisin family serine protease